MSARHLYIYGDPANLRYALLRGTGLRAWLRDSNIPAMRSNVGRGWHVRTERVGDVIARAEQAGFTVHMRGEVAR